MWTEAIFKYEPIREEAFVKAEVNSSEVFEKSKRVPILFAVRCKLYLLWLSLFISHPPLKSSLKIIQKETFIPQLIGNIIAKNGNKRYRKFDM
jgi:hypothetical protein